MFAQSKDKQTVELNTQLENSKKSRTGHQVHFSLRVKILLSSIQCINIYIVCLGVCVWVCVCGCVCEGEKERERST